MAFIFEGKEMHSIFVFAKCCWSIHSKVIRLGKNAHSKQREATPTQTLQFHVKFMYVHALLVQHLYGAFLQHLIRYGPTSETALCREGRKFDKKYTDFTELKKITSRYYSNCSIYSSLFLKSLKCRCCLFCFIKNVQLTVQVCCLFYFLLHSTFFKR